MALVQTVDFLTPLVDDPYTFGAIAAANAISDCCTAGARVLTGLNLVSFPRDADPGILREILRGGADKMLEAGGLIVGGHSVADNEPKYGLAITGVVHPGKLVQNSGAEVGDVLVLTKKIGTGIITNARNRGQDGSLISEAAYSEVIESMLTLNCKSSELMVELGVHACTDVTGFGLLGHAHNLALASNAALEISYAQVPRFEQAEALAVQSIGRAGKSNRNWIDSWISSTELSPEQLALLCDAQTSGPLLIALPEEKGKEFRARLHQMGMSAAAVIGRVVEGRSGSLVLRA